MGVEKNGYKWYLWIKNMCGYRVYGGINMDNKGEIGKYCGYKLHVWIGNKK